MKVFKFGGASVNSIERIENVGKIIKEYSGESLVVIISAMGKTTNALEKVAEAFFKKDKEEALSLFEAVKQSHLTTAKYLLVTTYNAAHAKLVNFFTEVEWLLHDKPVRAFDYYYDQIVCIGELLSTCLVSAYLNEIGIDNRLLDVRDYLRTDDNFRDATVDWSITKTNLEQLDMHNGTTYVTQGFIGATDENESTTLGREGSDYSAAIFANIFEAESLTIWKDVEGVMSADPKYFPDATFINQLDFNEVIEMAFYGAQVIHPKTIKPLENKKIPLHVRCFLQPQLAGTIISSKRVKGLPPIVVIKQNQALLHLHSRDFSFVGERPMSALYKLFEEVKVKPNLIQSGAISVQICMDDREDKIELLASAADGLFDVQIEKDLQLLTIRHYTLPLLNQMTAGKKIVLQQLTHDTVQVLYKN